MERVSGSERGATDSGGGIFHVGAHSADPQISLSRPHSRSPIRRVHLNRAVGKIRTTGRNYKKDTRIWHDDVWSPTTEFKTTFVIQER